MGTKFEVYHNVDSDWNVLSNYDQNTNSNKQHFLQAKGHVIS